MANSGACAVCGNPEPLGPPLLNRQFPTPTVWAFHMQSAILRSKGMPLARKMCDWVGVGCRFIFCERTTQFCAFLWAHKIFREFLWAHKMFCEFLWAHRRFRELIYRQANSPLGCISWAHTSFLRFSELRKCLVSFCEMTKGFVRFCELTKGFVSSQNL